MYTSVLESDVPRNPAGWNVEDMLIGSGMLARDSKVVVAYRRSQLNVAAEADDCSSSRE